MVHMFRCGNVVSLVKPINIHVVQFYTVFYIKSCSTDGSANRNAEVSEFETHCILASFILLLVLSFVCFTNEAQQLE